MRYRKLPRSNQVFLYGVHPVRETLKSGRRRIHEIFLARNAGIYSEFNDFQTLLGFRVKSVSPAELVRLSGSPNHQGIVACADPYPYTDLTEILESISRSSECLIMLDQIQDPFNVGSIIRTSECLGAMGVVITKNNTCGVTPAVEKTSAGATAHISVARVVNLTNAIERAKNAGFWVYGMDANGTTDIYSVDLAPLSAFVLGGEGSGIRRLVREHCDDILSVPIYGKVASLNVSHTAAIALSEYRRRNHEKKGVCRR